MLKPSEGKLSLRAEHRTVIEHIGTEAERIAGAARLIADLAGEVLQNGGQLNIQQQLMFLTGALMRLQKDAGVLEHLQRHNAVQPTSPVRKTY